MTQAFKIENTRVFMTSKNDSSEGANRAHWGSSLSFFLAASGAAIGLGNIWKFPYIVGINGGGAFIAVYLLALICIGVPILFAEIFCGQRSAAQPIKCYHIEHQSFFKKMLPLIPTFGLLGAFLIISFYAVIGGWVSHYTYLAFKGDILIKSALPENILGSLKQQLFFHFAFMAGVFLISVKGFKKGIEAFNLVAMPGLFLLLIGLLIFCCVRFDLTQTFDFLFYPHFEDLSVYAVMEAIGHAFFTLGVGVCALLTYGSYLKPSQKVFPLSLSIAFFDTFVAILCAVVIFSIVFSFGFKPDVGPKLIFVTLPELFALLPFSYVLSSSFFLLVFFAAITSAISMVEPLIDFTQERFFLSRKIATLIICSLSYLLGIFVILSSDSHYGFTFFSFSLFDLFDKLSTHILMPFVGMSTSIFVGWKYENAIKDQMSDYPALIHKLLIFFLRWVAPSGVLGVAVYFIVN